MQDSEFSDAVLNWYDQHGRKNLPWQHDITPYRVWLSEIMLQQTQVTTVISYFERFVAACPNVSALAKAPLDEVLHLWTGLGYYARARNLHKAAVIITDTHGGEFPDSVDQLCELPGIGRSTAGAICAIAFKKRAVIMDGNVKRVLSRVHRVAGWAGQASVSNELWQLAECYTPEQRVDHYTQAIMDLGATVCVRGQPNCAACPVAQRCEARRHDCVQSFPQPKPRKTIPTRHIQMLLIENTAGEIWLEKRPAQGIWGGLWSLPELATEENAVDYCEQQLQIAVNSCTELEPHRHTFSHFHLQITPLHIKSSQQTAHVMEDQQQLWYNMRNPANVGLAAPVKRLLREASNRTSAC
ncbi:MAG: A/G-specific adenine glycosylase [Pseudomonadales bacterium]